MKAVIYGASGQDGFYLKQLCENHGIEVVACSRSNGPWIRADVGNFPEVQELISQHKPRFVFHLAALSSTRHDALLENHQTIATGTINLLEACYRSSPESRIFLCGSGLQFKNTGAPIAETEPFAATSAYAASRIASVYSARYFRGRGMRVYVGYLFHHDSPLRRSGHMSQIVASAAARIAKGSKEILEIGNMDVEKEWTFAGDVVEAIWCLVNQETVYEAAIGSGQSYTIKKWALECFSRVGLNASDHIKAGSNFMPEYDRLLCDPRTIQSLGWLPKVSIAELASMMVDASIERDSRKL